MIENRCLAVRLDRITKKLSALQTTLWSSSEDLNMFLEENSENEDLDLDFVIYSSESVEGVADIIDDIKNDICSLSEQIIGNPDDDMPLTIPDKI